MTKPLRTVMPFTASIVDDFREFFPEAGIVETVRAGMNGQPVFFAREAGHEVGTPLPDLSGREVSLCDVVLGSNADLINKR